MNEQKEEGDKYVPLPTVWVWHDPAHGPCWGRWISCSRHCWKRPALDTAKKKKKKQASRFLSPPCRVPLRGNSPGPQANHGRRQGCTAGKEG